jgi:predicted AAA+ superfamily ATPase
MKKSELYVQVLTKLSALLDRHVGSPQDGTVFAGCQAFVWDANRRRLDPVKRPVTMDHNDLIGIDAIKREVIRNTRNFLEGLRSNNVLLWGERGTGKSSLVKSLLTTFSGTNLKLIQVYKNDILTIRDLYDLVFEHSEYRFIILIDDLSFEEGQTDFKEMKTILDGGLHAVPDNLLFYATSNRKHLIPTRFSDNDNDDVRPSDTIEEKVSLVERFGLRFGFYHLSQETYLEIVAFYAGKYGVRMSLEELNRRALEWATSAGGRNGRVAEQFARTLLAGESSP